MTYAGGRSAQNVAKDITIVRRVALYQELGEDPVAVVEVESASWTMSWDGEMGESEREDEEDKCRAAHVVGNAGQSR